MAPHDSDTPPLGGPFTTADNSPSARLSGLGQSRQTRRLQLRNTGFRAVELPPRSTTPNPTSSSNPSTKSDTTQSSDAENRSPSGPKSYTGPLKIPRSRQQGVLAEKGNTPSKQKTPKQRTPSGRHLPKNGKYEALRLHCDGEVVPIVVTPKNTPRSKASKARARMEKRRTFSAEADKYIEQLEAELVTIQTHLTSINSDDVARENGARMRALQAENKKLQEDLSQWETKYEETVQEQVAKHFEIESGLRLHIRTLEQNREEATYRIHEMEQQVESTTKTLEAVEKANVQLEKRVEIMSELLAASPTRIDLHTESGPRRRHAGTKSALFRFPTTNLMQPVNEHTSTSGPTSPQPLHSPMDLSPTLPSNSLRKRLSTLKGICPLSDQASDAESIFSDAHFGDAVPSPGTFETGSVIFNPSVSTAPLSPKSKPVRRMRRFGAGSVKPKPLILSSSTSQPDFSAPTSAPAHERSTTIQEFPEYAWSTGSPTSPGGRRRALTMTDANTQTNNLSSPRNRSSTEANAQTLANYQISPFMHPKRKASEAFSNDTTPDRYPSSAGSESTTREFPLAGHSVGRNLLEELTAARSSDSATGTTQSEDPGGTNSQSMDCVLSIQQWTEEVESVQSNDPVVLAAEKAENQGNEPPPITPTKDTGKGETPTASEMSLVATSSAATVHATSKHKRNHSRQKSTHHTLSTWQRLRLLFGSFCKTPADFARHLIQTAQARMRIPMPLLSVQWWLVGVLLGPMARRRKMLPSKSPSECCTPTDRDKHGTRLTAYSSSDSHSNGLEYGTMWLTPPGSPILSTVSGGVVRHTGGRRCTHHYPRHSPMLWLRFSFTLAFAVGIAFKDGPGSLMKATTACACALPRRRPISSGRQSPALMA